jgi:regulation of enolase protein 1 (concanavalin A-like superfamily)
MGASSADATEHERDKSVPDRNHPTELMDSRGSLVMLAPARSDFFLDPTNAVRKSNAPFYYQSMKGDFVAKVVVRPDFKTAYDAGGLLVMDSTKRWIKLAFELTDLGYPSVVSVVTSGSSDDCNGERVQGTRAVHLQIVRNGQQWALHYSRGGRRWKMVRTFRLKMKDEVRVGIEVQSPLGQGCRAVFRQLSVAPGSVKDLRQGR